MESQKILNSRLVVANGWWKGGRGDCLIDMGFLFRKLKKFMIEHLLSMCESLSSTFCNKKENKSSRNGL
jgi:hypothetical protein